MKKSLMILVAAVLSMSAFAAVAGGSVATVKHPTYALGSKHGCRDNYVKRTKRHEVKGHEVRYVACVYVTPVLFIVPVTTSVPPSAITSVVTSTVPATGAVTTAPPVTTTTMATVPTPVLLNTTTTETVVLTGCISKLILGPGTGSIPTEYLVDACGYTVTASVVDQHGHSTH